MKKMLETSWLRSIIESEHMLSKELPDEELEDLVDDWCDQALVEGDLLDRNELLRQLREWLDN